MNMKTIVSIGARAARPIVTLIISLVALAASAQTKVSQYPAITAVGTNDLLLITRSNVGNYKITFDAFASNVSTSAPLTALYIGWSNGVLTVARTYTNGLASTNYVNSLATVASNALRTDYLAKDIATSNGVLSAIASTPHTNQLAWVSGGTFDSGVIAATAGHKITANFTSIYLKGAGAIGYKTNITRFYFASTNGGTTAFTLNTSFYVPGYRFFGTIDTNTVLTGIEYGTTNIVVCSFTNFNLTGFTNTHSGYRLINSTFNATNTIWLLGGEQELYP
jgi:hypothetical protein